jgi:DNA-binding MarR family transcriptional regulator
MIDGFNDLIHQPLRLKIMATMDQLFDDPHARIDFGQLKEITGATDGNLGAHIAALEKAGYIDVEKKFIGKRPNTALRMTEEGAKAYAAHIAALRQIIGGQ